MSRTPKTHEIYRHFKGNLYQILAIAEHSETREELVIYQALYGEYKIYARPLIMFNSEVDFEKYPEVKQQYRFELFQPGQPVDENLVDVKIEETKNSVQKEDEEEIGLDPLVLEFLDADTYEEKLNILAAIHHRVTDELLTVMAVACDLEISDGEVEDRFQQLKNCLLMKEKFECNRMR